MSRFPSPAHADRLDDRIQQLDDGFERLGDRDTPGFLDHTLVCVDMHSDEGYSIQENTGNPTQPSIDTVINRDLKRAADPRPTDHPDGHFDRYIVDAIERFGEDIVVNCTRLAFLKDYTHRMVGTAAFGEEDYVWGINVGIAATAYLRELRPRAGDGQ